MTMGTIYIIEIEFAECSCYEAICGFNWLSVRRIALREAELCFFVDYRKKFEMPFEYCLHIHILSVTDWRQCFAK